MMIIHLKCIAEKCFLFNINVNTNLKLLWALGGLSEGNQGLGHRESTWTLRWRLGIRAVGGHSKSTQAPKALRYLDT